MTQVNPLPFATVDLFGLLGINPHKLRGLSNKRVLKELRQGYYRAMLTVHPDKDRSGSVEAAQQLNALKDTLRGFDAAQVHPDMVTGLVEKGCQECALRRDRQSTRDNRILRQAASQPGSSPSNPIVLDPGLIGVSPLRKAPRKSRKMTRSKRRRTRR